MNKTMVIVKHEFLSRVKKKSFIIGTLLLPLLMILIMIIPTVLMFTSFSTKTIAVIDETGELFSKMESSSNVKLVKVQGTEQDIKTKLIEQYDGVVMIPHLDYANPTGIKVFSKKQIGVMTTSYVKGEIEQRIEDIKYAQAGISEETRKSLQVDINLDAIIMDKGAEKKSNLIAAAAVSQVMGFVLYFVIFIYGSMIMKSVMDEKKNRIVEIFVSSLKPFQLMLGKIFGIALVALTQLLIWTAFFSLLSFIGTMFILPHLLPQDTGQLAQQMMQDSGPGKIMQFMTDLNGLNLPLIGFSFFFFFITGYLLYSALFALVGVLVGENGENQSYSLITTLPVVLAFMIMFQVVNDPHSKLSVITSLIPFFAPIVMVARIPFNVPGWQLILSMALMVVGFIGTTWIAGKVYRVGILMYGKKISMKELWRWICYKAD